MRLFGNLFKTIVGIVTSIVAVGCSHIKGEDIKAYYGPAPAPEPPQAEEPEIVPNSDDIDNPPADIYGPPEVFGYDEPVEMPEIEEPAPPVYGPPPSDIAQRVAPTIDGQPIQVTVESLTVDNNHWNVKLVNAGRKKGIERGATGEFRIGEHAILNGTFKVMTVLGNSCLVLTDATIDQLPKEHLGEVNSAVFSNLTKTTPKNEEPPTAIYGPPEAFQNKPEADDIPSTIYGPPEALKNNTTPSKNKNGNPPPNYPPPEIIVPPPDDSKVESNNHEEDIPLSLRVNHPMPGINLVETGNVNDKREPKEQEPTEPITEDIKGSFTTLDAELLTITFNKDYRTIKLNVGSTKGVVDGAVGEFYIGDQIVKNGRFKITKINETNCSAKTNATSKQIKAATKVVIKIPKK